MTRDGRISSSPRTFSTRDWPAVAELAEQQHGVVGLQQLRDLRVCDSTVRGMVSTQRLIRLHQGVFAVGHSVLRPEGHYLGAVLACGPGAALSHRSAAALWGIRSSAAAKIDVTSSQRCGRKKAGLRVHRGDRLLADEITVERNVPCTTVARTLLDLAGVLPGRGPEAAVETSERLEVFDLRAVSILLGRHRGRRGAARLRRAIAAFDPELIRTRTETEARCYCLCVDAGLPKPASTGSCLRARPHTRSTCTGPRPV